MRTEPDVAIEHVHHPKHGPVSRLSRRGWSVDITDTGAVVVPVQTTSGKTTADLRYLLSAAYAMAEAPLQGAYEPVTASTVEHVIAALRAGYAAALASTRPTQIDVYQCAAAGWDRTGQNAPYRLVIDALRAALPPKTTLVDHPSDAVPDLFRRAIELRSRPPAAHPRGSVA
ncbi:hypothetical protein [Mycolicibacterium llatzerense]|uniref:hypothetical protein n=1 Tax=Mycolicibacterium llatzerense TaxID=280871 RepID=UPI0031DCECD8